VADPRLIFGVLQVFLLVLFFAQSPKAVVESGSGFVAPASDGIAWTAHSDSEALRLQQPVRLAASKRKDPTPEPIALASDEQFVAPVPALEVQASTTAEPARSVPSLGPSPRGPPLA
jgi:hypothetical protein